MTFAFYRKEGDYVAEFPAGQDEELIAFDHSPDNPQIFVDRQRNPMTGRRNPLTASQKATLHQIAKAQRDERNAHIAQGKVTARARGTTPQTWSLFDSENGLNDIVDRLPAGVIDKTAKPNPPAVPRKVRSRA